MKQTAARLVLFCLLALSAPAFSGDQGLTITGVRYFSYADFTRIVFEIESAAPYVIRTTADGRSLLLSAYDAPLTLKSTPPAVRDGVVNGIEQGEEAGRNVIIVRMGDRAGDAKDFVLRAPDRIVLDIQRGAKSVPAPAGERIVVALDPGHGGKDTGITTARGLEKITALEVAKAVRRLLRKDTAMKVIMTRERDASPTFEERAAAANAAGADIFVSIHAANGRGARIYIQDPEHDLAGKIARAPGRNFPGFTAGNEQREWLWGRQQAAHAKESGALGRLLARHATGQNDAEPVQAPVAGLRAVDAPAVLFEFGMEQDRTKAAEAIAKGIAQYAGQNR